MIDLTTLLGLTEYEGRVYRALLTESPATAYRLGKVSGVPLSRVYEAASRLVDKGAATVKSGEPVRYVPVSPGTLIAEAKARTAGQLDSLERELAALFESDSAAQDVWVGGEGPVLARLGALAQDASRQIVIACSQSSHQKVRDVVQPQTGVLLDFVKVEDRAGRATFAALMDGRMVVIGSLGESARALVTTEPAFAALLNDYFRMKLSADSVPASIRPPVDLHADWLDWEKEKQDRLLGIRIPVNRR